MLYPGGELCYNPDIELTCSPESVPSLNTVASNSARYPLAAYQQQETVFARAFALLNDAIPQRAFPAASVAVTHQGKLVALNAFGRLTYDADSPEVTPASMFDLASVTKVVATTAIAMILYQRGLLNLEAPVCGVLPEFAQEAAPRREVTFRMLLAHSSGLPAHEKYYLNHHSREEVLAAALSTPLTAEPGTRVEYSDVGFMVLGMALERIADEPLDRFCQREIFGPLGMARTSFNPPSAWRASIPPTANDETFRHRIIQGEVYDENASVLGVAPQAGLFATAQDVATYAHALLQAGSPLLRPETIARFTRRETAPAGTSRALGWDTPSSPSQSGKYFSAKSFGHLGYTGTSLWIDPERQLSITLLTNRTWPDSRNQSIKEVRPKFHDAVIEALKESGRKH